MTEATIAPPEAAPTAADHHAAPPARPFTVQEEAAFVAEDRQAATMVCGIMMTIFVAAVVLYTVIAFVAAGW